MNEIRSAADELLLELDQGNTLWYRDLYYKHNLIRGRFIQALEDIRSGLKLHYKNDIIAQSAVISFLEDSWEAKTYFKTPLTGEEIKDLLVGRVLNPVRESDEAKERWVQKILEAWNESSV